MKYALEWNAGFALKALANSRSATPSNVMLRRRWRRNCDHLMFKRLTLQPFNQNDALTQAPTRARTAEARNWRSDPPRVPGQRGRLGLSQRCGCRRRSAFGDSFYQYSRDGRAAKTRVGDADPASQAHPRAGRPGGRVEVYPDT